MDCLISIVVPVHNVEPYLRPCIESILSQSLSDFECILVDDGSTDGSGTICDEYASKDRRIQAIHKDNGGVSSARNLGLEHAKGTWVYFVDSDDQLLPGCLQSLVNGISDGIDAICGGYESYDQNGLVDTTDREVSPSILSRTESLLLLYPNHTRQYPYLGYVWIWMFRNSIIQKHNLRFNQDIKIKEDALFITQFLCLSDNKTVFDPKPLYKYCLRSESAMGSLSMVYNPAYLTSFDAVVQMHFAIHSLPHVERALSLASKYDVVNRAHLIKVHMKRYHAIDYKTLRDIRRRAIQEVGLTNYLFCQVIRNLNKIK